jgi:hypothetical protein
LIQLSCELHAYPRSGQMLAGNAGQLKHADLRLAEHR